MTTGRINAKQFYHNELFNIERGDYIKKDEVVFKLVNTDKVWGVLM
jgi:Cu(I)/Ag(I) efflux system membrane fusion protein